MKRSTTALAAALTLTAFSTNAAELRMSWWGGDSRHQATQAGLEVCGAKYGHSIKPEFTGWGGHLEKVTTQLAGRTEADIMQINWPWLPFFSKDGTGFADINALSDIVDLSNLSADQIAAGTMNGKLNGLPVSTTGRVFWFNKSTFDKAGLALPTTWEELIAAGPVIAEKVGENVYPFEGIKLDAALLVQNYLTQITGKSFIDDATLTVAWSEDELAEGIAFYQTLVDNHVMQDWKSYAGAGNVKLHENPLWADGTIGGSYQWDSSYFKFADALNEGQELVPAGLLTTEKGSNTGVYRKASMVFAISANSDNKEAAAQIVNCMLNEKEGIAALGTARGLPASQAALAQLTSNGEIDAVQKLANDQVIAAAAPVISPFVEHPEVQSAFEDALELFAYGEIDAAEAASDIVYIANEALENYR